MIVLSDGWVMVSVRTPGDEFHDVAWSAIKGYAYSQENIGCGIFTATQLCNGCRTDASEF